MIVLTGTLIATLGLLGRGGHVTVARRPLLAIAAAIASFVIVIPPFSLAAAVLSALMVSAAAERPISPPHLAGLSLVLIVIGNTVFVAILGMPIPLVRLP